MSIINRALHLLRKPFLKLIYRRYIKYMPIARSIGNELSKGRNTKVGAIILDDLRNVKAVGYNGAARGSNADSLMDMRNTKPEKYNWIVHAEANAICNAAMSGSMTRGNVMIATNMPCIHCATLIAQSGIKAVVTIKPTDRFISVWRDSIKRTKILFNEVCIDLIVIDKN